MDIQNIYWKQFFYVVIKNESLKINLAYLLLRGAVRKVGGAAAPSVPLLSVSLAVGWWETHFRFLCMAGTWGEIDNEADFDFDLWNMSKEMANAAEL